MNQTNFVAAEALLATPLSFGQERLFFLQRLDPESWHYNLRVFLRIQGSLDANALERAVRTIVDRHEVLRTVFDIVDGNPTQVVRPPHRFELTRVNIAGEEDPEKEALRVAAARLREPFDLRCGPLLRGWLFALGAADHILLLTMHHVVTDAWSMGVLSNELRVLYGAYASGEPASLPDLPLQYVDYARWQRQWLEQEACGTQLEFWKRQLAGVPPVLLPTTKHRPPVQSYQGGFHNFAIPVQLGSQLKDFSRRESATLFMSLLAAYSVLLYRYTGQADLTIGAPISGRNRQEFEGLIGFFLNVIAMRLDVNGGVTFRQLVKRARRVALDAYGAQDVPFEKLVEELQPERDLSRSPLFQVMLVVQHADALRWTLPGLAVTQTGPTLETTKLDLTLFVTDRPDRLEAGFNYATDLFDHEYITRMAAHFVQLLEGVLSHPDLPIGELDLLGAEEQRQFAAAQGPLSSIPNACVQDLFGEQAARTPNAPAVADESHTLTYGELDRRSNQLARYLRKRGAGPERNVAVCLRLSADVPVVLLGVLKSGAAYVPLDPSYPAARLAFMLADCRASALLIDGASTTPLHDFAGARISLEREWGEIGLEDTAPLEGTDHPDNRAYVIYTSGSTGPPKGVEITHRALVNFLVSMRSLTGIGARDRLLAVTSLSFDIAGLEIYLPLIVGGSIRTLDRESASDGRRLAEVLADGFTFMQATPSTWLLLLEAGWRGNPELKVLCGGEALTPSLAERLYPRVAALWNLYGPTETTIWSLAELISGSGAPITIGRPITNTRAYVLDENGMPVPTWIEGELYLAGAGLARGYFGRPELTAERFVPDPFSTDLGARLYRTGDRVRRLPDGRLEFLGRRDHQVKIRGHRIELGEIESALERQPSVSQAVVVAVAQKNGETALVAHVIGVSTADPSELKAALKEILPRHMVPSAIRFVDEFPLTPNGKTDRNALARATTAVEPERPRTPFQNGTRAENAVVRALAEVLGVEDISLEDNFFDLGGDSLLAMRALARIQAALSVEPSMRALFTEDTIGGFARTLEICTTSATP